MTKKSLFYTCLAIFSLVLFWVVAYFIIGNEYLLPAPWESAVSAGKLFAQGSFYLSVLNTLLRTLIAFFTAFLLGVGLALVATFAGFLRGFLAPVVSFLRTLPTMAIILALLVWTNPLVAPVVVTFLVLFPVTYSHALASFDAIKVEYGRFLTAYKIRNRRQIASVYLPLSAPTLLSQVGGYLSMGIKVMVSSEVLSSTAQSLGGMMTLAQIYLDMPRLLALTVVAVALGFLIEGACALITKKVVRWRR